MKGLLIIALVALIAALGWGVWQYKAASDNMQRAKVAEAQAASLKETVAAQERAAASLTDHLQRVEAQREQWRARAEELENAEGINDDLSPYLRGVLERVR